MSKLTKALTAAAGNAGGTLGYVEDVFSTYLYDGTGATQTITNGIDLSGEGGLVWIKLRSTSTTYSFSNSLFDTERGALYDIHTNNTGPNGLYSNSLTSFNSDGFSLGTDPSTGLVNYGTGTNTYASWTFRKAEKFFDVVTYTGDGVAGRTVAHNLGSQPAVMIIKNLTTNGRNWAIYHGSLGNTQALDFTTGAAFTWTAWNSTSPTDSVFTVSADPEVNANGESFVAYLFASDAGGFGDDGSENIIKCGSYTGNGSNTNGPVINLGFEPQWLLVKSTSNAYDWMVVDTMRGMPAYDGFSNTLRPNTSVAESASHRFNPSATGFQVNDDNALVNASGGTYIYIAIRRPMKTPESGTEVFAIDTRSATTPAFSSNFPVDFFSYRAKTGSDWYSQNRLTGGGTLYFNRTGAENSIGGLGTANFDYQDGVMSSTANIPNIFSYMFKRATGFMDVVAYTSTTSAINHNLGVSPELVIYKPRTAGTWYTMVATDGFGELNGSGAWGGAGNGSGLGPNLANATATTITGGGNLYGNGVSMVTYLFATLAGVSKVGSYTGTGSNIDVDCGFSAGARFILIKRTDSTGDWYVWDSARGITAGNDPYLLLNTTAAEVTNTDYIDPLSSGFTVTSSAPAALNASGGTYIFLAIA